MERVLVKLTKLKLSNCLIEAILIRVRFKYSCIGFDFNSPSRSISFYCDTVLGRHRFRRKIFRHGGNKNKLLFIGYNIIETNENKK